MSFEKNIDQPPVLLAATVSRSDFLARLHYRLGFGKDERNDEHMHKGDEATVYTLDLCSAIFVISGMSNWFRRTACSGPQACLPILLV